METSLALCTLLLFYLLSEKNPSASITDRLYHSKPSSSATHETSMYRDELETALEGASMANKTVIIAVVNRAYTEGDKPMFDIFLDGFWLGEDTRNLTNHLLIVVVDQTAFERCRFLRLHCYKLKTDGEDFVGEKVYMSEDFIKLMWLRTRFLGDVLRRGYNFVFTATDILWLRNPFSRLTLNETVDFQISVDQFNGDQWSQTNPLNSGFYMIRSNNKTIALFDEWYGQRNNSPGKKEQDVLFELMHKGAFKRLGLRVRFLDTIYFSGFLSKIVEMFTLFQLFMQIVAGVLERKSLICSRLFMTGKVLKIHLAIKQWNIDGRITWHAKDHGVLELFYMNMF